MFLTIESLYKQPTISYIAFHCGFELCSIEMFGTCHVSLILEMYKT